LISFSSGGTKRVSIRRSEIYNSDFCFWQQNMMEWTRSEAGSQRRYYRSRSIKTRIDVRRDSKRAGSHGDAHGAQDSQAPRASWPTSRAQGLDGADLHLEDWTPIVGRRGWLVRKEAVVRNCAPVIPRSDAWAGIVLRRAPTHGGVVSLGLVIETDGDRIERVRLKRDVRELAAEVVNGQAIR
jgi:hypothetical protein